MGTETENYKFQKPGEDDFYDITVQNQNWDLVDEELYEIKKSVSDGKTLVAAAITEKRVAAAASDTFAVLAQKIRQIVLGSGDATKADVLAGKTFTNDDGVEYTGTMADKSGTTQSAAPSLDAANSRLQMTIPATGKYSTTSKLYAAYATIRTLIGLTADKLWANTTILGLKSSRTAQAAETWTPGIANQTIAAGTCITGVQTIKGDSNLIAANIKKGVSIFGITGTWEGYVAKTTTIFSEEDGNVDGFNIPTGCGISSGHLWWNPSTFGSYVRVITKNDYNLSQYDKLRIYVNIDPTYEYSDIDYGISYYNSLSESATLTCYFGNSVRVYRTNDGYTYITVPLNNFTATGKLFIRGTNGLRIFYWQLIKD